MVQIRLITSFIQAGTNLRTVAKWMTLRKVQYSKNYGALWATSRVTELQMHDLSRHLAKAQTGQGYFIF